MEYWGPSSHEASALIGTTRASRRSCNDDLGDVIQPCRGAYLVITIDCITEKIREKGNVYSALEAKVAGNSFGHGCILQAIQCLPLARLAKSRRQ